MNTRLKIALYLNFFIVAVLLNSGGVVIMQMVNNFGVDRVDASILEAFKDLTIAISAFFVASFIPRLGYKNAMLTALVIMCAGCLVMPLINGFWAAKFMFAMTGFSFMLLKIVVYSLIGLYAENDKAYTSSVGILEGFFSFSILIGTSLFGLFILLKEQGYGGVFSYGWINTYWLLAVMCALSFALVSSCKIDESEIQPSEDSTPLSDMQGMLSLLAKPVVIAFVLCIFTYVFVEQAIQTWLPKLYNDVFSLSESAAVFLAGSWPLSIAAGRLTWGIAMRYCDWFKVLVGGLLAGIAVMMSVSVMIKADPTGNLVALPFTELKIPLAALLLPSIGFFIGAIYPTVCASVLSSLEKTKHSPMTGWIIVFSAFGGTVGSRMMAIFYENSSGVGAIAMLVYPVVFMLAVLLPYAYLRKRAILRNKSYAQFANT